jgi:hypothetical protein
MEKDGPPVCEGYISNAAREVWSYPRPERIIGKEIGVVGQKTGPHFSRAFPAMMIEEEVDKGDGTVFQPPYRWYQFQQGAPPYPPMCP